MTSDASTTTHSRRTVLRTGLTAAAVIAIPGTIAATGVGKAGAAAAPRGNPFALGVASGEPTPEGMVLWTRLATDPLAEDGLGGIGNRVTEVEWELAGDEGFRQILRSGTERTGPELGHSVHVETAGLAPGHDYFYRFRVGSEISPAGRTRTAPPPQQLQPLTMCFTSCSQYEHGFFTAYARLAEEEPDLVLHLGDYQYEYAKGRYEAPGGNVRDHAGPETVTLANYRQRYAQYKSDADLQAAHAVAPWLVVFDDHEVENNWAGNVRELPEDPPGPLAPRRAAAFQAYWENMPLRAAQRPRGDAMQLHRRVNWGATATFHMLDTRQYRSDQPCGDRFGTDCAARTDPAASLPGSAQERWIADGFRSSTARWDVLGQQVFFSQVDFTPGAGRGFNPDAWDGTPASRDRVVDSWVDARNRNTLVLTGDVHAHWGADIKQRFDDPASPVVGTELISSSITSGGDGSESQSTTAAILADNPHLRFYNNRRGYVRTTFGPTEVRADFRVVPYVQRPGAPAETRGAFVIEDRKSGLQAV
ncbi:alkaline phosphatase D family protein [Pseudonocardia sp. GCM10023141]|uniref:alkaline phosphatase D family protein n=1 Tax=Pseudonocardia sp. GCM10023141 TaxID=3252653 RepID=UPI00361CF206